MVYNIRKITVCCEENGDDLPKKKMPFMIGIFWTFVSCNTNEIA